MLWDLPTIVHCSRCGAPCKLAETTTEDARLLKHATRPETSGYCPDCATAHFLQTSPMGQLIRDPQMLLAPHVQQQFARVMKAGNADAQPEEINWQRVVENWNLPFAKTKKSRKK